jgi:predicted transcriptional regulator YdeE
MEAIGGWLRRTGHQHIFRPGAPGVFERYGEAFDARTGTGDIEIWLPIDSKPDV